MAMRFSQVRSCCRGARCDGFALRRRCCGDLGGDRAVRAPRASRRRRLQVEGYVRKVSPVPLSECAIVLAPPWGGLSQAPSARSRQAHRALGLSGPVRYGPVAAASGSSTSRRPWRQREPDERRMRAAESARTRHALRRRSKRRSSTTRRASALALHCRARHARCTF